MFASEQLWSFVDPNRKVGRLCASLLSWARRRRVPLADPNRGLLSNPEDDPANNRPASEPSPAAAIVDRAFARLRTSSSPRSRRDKHLVAAALFGEPEPETEPEVSDEDPARAAPTPSARTR